MATSVSKVKRVVSITSISLKTILSLFQYKPDKCLILKLKANGSTIVESPTIQEERLLGIKITLNRITNKFDLNYSTIFDDNGKPTNPIDSNAVQTISNALSSSGIHDAVVSGLELKIKDPELQNIAKTKVDEFHIKFVSDPTDGELDKTKVKEHPENRALLEQSRMQYRILNCREVIDRHQELTEPKSNWKYQIIWIGHNLSSLESPLEFAVQLRTHLGDYGLLKQYDQTQEDKLVLISVDR